MSYPVVNAFTVDVEDYFQVSGFEDSISRNAWDTFERRVVANTRRPLELLDVHCVRGTFFILGWIARREPQLVREIRAAGHELGSHSYWHRLIYQLSPAAFRRDVRDSIAAIEDAAGVTVTSYRAPSFSITAKSLWALEILAEEGITVDSSIVPTRHDRYGIPEANPELHSYESAAGTIREFPPTIARLAGCNVPVAGGGYFRLYPWWLTQALLRQVQQSRQLMFYVHPWEVDPNQPRLGAGSQLSRFRHYVNLKTTLSKLELLLDSFRWSTMSNAIAASDHYELDVTVPSVRPGGVMASI